MSFVFLCHASEDRALAERIQVALATAGHEVFFDQDSLHAGDDYNGRIGQAIGRCDVFVFVASPHSLAEGRYTLTELKFVRQRWPSPAGRVLTVNAGGLQADALPPYLAAATLLEARGNVAAEARAAVDRLLAARALSDASAARRRAGWYVAAGVALLAAAGVAATPALQRSYVGAQYNLSDLHAFWLLEANPYKVADGFMLLEIQVTAVRFRDRHVLLTVASPGFAPQELRVDYRAPRQFKVGPREYQVYIDEMADFADDPDRARTTIKRL